MVWCDRFAKAVHEAVSAPVSNTAALEDLSTLLSVPPLLLSCDLAAADFWRVSAAAEQLKQQRPKRPRVYSDTLPAEAAPVTALLGVQRLVPAKRPRMMSRPVMQLLAGTAAVSGGGRSGAAKGKLEEAKSSGAGGDAGCCGLALNGQGLANYQHWLLSSAVSTVMGDWPSAKKLPCVHLLLFKAVSVMVFCLPRFAVWPGSAVVMLLPAWAAGDRGGGAGHPQHCCTSQITGCIRKGRQPQSLPACG